MTFGSGKDRFRFWILFWEFEKKSKIEIFSKIEKKILVFFLFLKKNLKKVVWQRAMFHKGYVALSYPVTELIYNDFRLAGLQQGLV